LLLTLARRTYLQTKQTIMLLQLLATSLDLDLSLAAPAVYLPRDDAANIVPLHVCSSRSWPTLSDFRTQATAICNSLIPNTKVDVHLPLSKPFLLKIPIPGKKRPAVHLPATFKITGFAKASLPRATCLEAFTAQDQKGIGEDIEKAQMELGNICSRPGDGVRLVQG
jgi:hypothetical protein